MTKELLQQALVNVHDAILRGNSDGELLVMIDDALRDAKAQQEQPASVDAYVGAREDAEIWKKRALEAEELNSKFIAELNGPTYLGEPVKQEQPTQEPRSVRITWTKLGTEFTDFFEFDNPTCPIGRDGNWKRDHWNARHLRPFNTGAKILKLESVIPLYTHPAPTQPALSDEQIIEIARKWSNRRFAESSQRFLLDFARELLEAHCRGGVPVNLHKKKYFCFLAASVTRGWGGY